MTGTVTSDGFPARVARDVRRRARDELPLALGDLAGWVGHDTPSGDARSLDELATLMASRIERYGARAELVSGETGVYLRGTLRGSGRARVALLGHHDTVFPGGTAAERPFAVDGDVARGPGVADMKGGLVVGAHVVRLLADRADAYAEIEYLSVPDEELREGPFEGIERLRDFDAVLCMECGRPSNGVVTARKGGQWISIRIEGLAAHAGVAADRGRSALLAACHETLRIACLDGARDGLSVNPTMLSAGEVLNSVPSRGALRVDVRAWHAADLDWAIGEVERFGAHPGVTLQLDPGARVPPFERAESSGLFAAAAEIGMALGVPIVEVTTGGVSDASWTADLGIPTLDGLGPIGEDDHSPAERIIVSSIPERIALVAGVVATIETRLEAAVASRNESSGGA
jgi:glutamate carboxypeptidase